MACSAPQNTTLLDVPPALIANILLQLAYNAPESIAACAVACSALETAISSQKLWQTLCKRHPAADDPASWNAPNWTNWSTLWACWVRPYLLPLTAAGDQRGQQLWHTNAFPSGQLVVIEPEPPFIVAKSLHYTSLTSGPRWHELWRAQLQPKDDARGVWVKVTCQRSKHDGDASASRLLAAVPGDLSAGFTLHCVGPSCNSASVELTNRRYVSQPYQPPEPASASAFSGGGGALPLPDVLPSPNADLLEFMTLATVGARHDPPLFTPLDPRRTWLGQPPCGAGSAAVGGQLRRLLGLWRGSYGSHGVEVVQLCLLASRRRMFGTAEAQGPLQLASELAADHSIDAVPGVLLQQQEEPQQQQQQQEEEEDVEQQHVLLVATKVTGDINVPCNHVTFAVDAHSACTAGAGEPLVLPPGYDADVALGQPGRRRLVVKERYRGRAQIARWGFEDAAVIAAELVVFTDDDCIGLLWKRPVESLSLFTRATGLPGL